MQGAHTGFMLSREFILLQYRFISVMKFLSLVLWFNGLMGLVHASRTAGEKLPTANAKRQRALLQGKIVPHGSHGLHMTAPGMDA